MPRFHTNQIPIFRGMKEKGHSVSCFVEYLGETENHDTVVPVQMNESFVSRMYLRYLKKGIRINLQLLSLDTVRNLYQQYFL